MTLTNPQRRVVLQAFAAAASTALLPAASAQPAAPFPHKPITLILPFPVELLRFLEAATDKATRDSGHVVPPAAPLTENGRTPS